MVGLALLDPLSLRKELRSAELIQLDSKNFDSLCPRGKEPDAIIGDWVLRNEHVVAILAAPIAGRNANMTVRNVGGMVIDYVPRSAQSDQLSCFYPAGARYQFDSEETAVVTSEKGQSPLEEKKRFEARMLSVTFKGKPVKGVGSEARITYTLSDGDESLGYKVELVNTSDADVELKKEDLLRCDGPTFSFGQDENSRLFWAEDKFYHQAYGILPDSGRIVRGKDNRSLAISIEGEKLGAIAAGKSVQWGGRLLCSQGLPGLRRLTDALASSKATQLYQLKLNAADGNVEQAVVEFFINGSSLGTVQSDREGWIRMRMAHGDYRLVIHAVGRPDREHQFSLGTSPVAESLTLEAATRVKGRITDQWGKTIPAKIQFVGREGTATPSFGPETSDFGVKDLLYTSDGIVSHPIAPGKYTIIVSHGPEFDAVTQSLEIDSGHAAQAFNVSLTRSVDTTGWVSGEFHSHSSPSGDNTSSQLGRVLNLLAEHIEFAPCTEHNRIDSYDEHLKLLKATERMATCTGMELTGSPLPVNHQNAFPLQRNPHHQDGGGPTTDVDPQVQIERLALWDKKSEKIVQINHPNIPQILGDRDLDGKSDIGFRKMLSFVDVIEVHPAEAIFTPPSLDTPPRDRVANSIFHWMQLQNLGYHVPGVVNTDAHYNWHGSGWLRNYIASPTDEPAKIRTEDMVHAIQIGHMVMTTAPFLQAELRATVAGQSRKFISGDRVALGANSAKLWIRVQCANWYDVNRVQIFANGRALPELNFTRASHPQLFKSGNVRFESEIELPKMVIDTHLIVATIGEGLSLGNVMGNAQAKVPPVAVTNPIYVDVDGGTFKPNEDDLGIPFMLLPGTASLGTTIQTEKNEKQ